MACWLQLQPASPHQFSLCLHSTRAAEQSVNAWIMHDIMHTRGADRNDMFEALALERQL